MDNIKQGDYLVVKSADDTGVFNIVRVHGDQKLLKSRVNLDDIVGQPYSSFYQLNGRRFQKISDIETTVDNDITNSTGINGQSIEETTIEVEKEAPTTSTTAAVPTESNQQFNQFSNQDILSYLSKVLEEKNANASVIRGDNSGYVDTNTAQKLKDADILKLREEGYNGTEIIKILIENSETFNRKTDYAQEKWIKRKEKKYNQKYQILLANPLTICESSFKKAKDKISNLRYDSFAQLLSQSGVHANCHVMVVESMVGMVVGAVAYRMQGLGRILSVYGGQQPHLEMARNYNLSPEALAIIEPIPAIELGPAAKDVRENGFHDYQEFELPKAVPVQEEEEENTSNKKGSKKRKLVIPEPKDQINSTGRAPEAQVRLRSYLRQGVDRLIIACKYRPLPILKQALSLLAPSSPFVIFHEFLEPLVDCYLYLQEHELALKLNLSDYWLREFQTLPGRMRPEMFMSTSGGYLLSGIYVGLDVTNRTLERLEAEKKTSTEETSSSKNQGEKMDV